MKNCKLFEAYKTNAVGVWYFTPCEGAFKIGKPCKGFGCIKYAEGSVYTGDIYYDGKNFNKLGYGQQDFSRSVIGCLISAIGEKKYKFVGQYDYRKTDWIYGNGAIYYTYAGGEPSHFVKGFFRGLDKVGEYKGEFDYSRLLDGYTAEMEFDYDENAVRLEELWCRILDAIDKTQKAKVLFLGDSYFEFADYQEFAGKNFFKNYFPENYVNCGIGGSKFSDWIQWIDKLKNITAPEKIVINLGFNDLNTGKTSEKTYRDFLELSKLLRGYFPETELYVLCIVHSPSCVKFLNAKDSYNAKIKEGAPKCGVVAAEWNSLIKESGLNCFHADGVHLNENGYGLFREFIDDLLKNGKI